ncbi:strictosidine synthase-like 2 [Actinidia rufa]|uniref:Strictosidine synthase-like 2 n=1 Tax=Actinidia rufa TaxID=165716 RepID=A0A7J0FD11_9ERIC|nr:strictosidine synthase-like 2 [Actinidia rufa]
MSSKLFLTTFSILLVSASLSLDYINILSHLFNTKKYLSNENHITIPIEGSVGPESLAFDPHHGGPYTGVSDGRIIKWLENERRWIDFAVTSQHR